MAVRTPTVRAITEVLVRANRWAVTGFEVRTPQDGAADSIAIYSEAAEVDGDGKRLAVTQLGLIELTSPVAIAALLADVGVRYEAYRQTATAPGVAMTLALREALVAVATAHGKFPADAEPEVVAEPLPMDPPPVIPEP
jgi:hypothetical protein